MNKEENIDYINNIHDSYIKEPQKQDEFIKQLQQENQKYKEVIDKAIEYIDDWLFNVGGLGACMDYKDINEILDILKEVE